MKIVYWLFLLFPLFGCSHLSKIQLCLNEEHKYIVFPISDSLKEIFTTKERKMFEKGYKLFLNDDHVQYRIYYVLNSGKKNITMEGYFYIDSQVGSGKEYYSNGKIMTEWDFIIINDSLKTIDLKAFNHLRKKAASGYYGVRNGSWKYYSEEGKLIRIEEYDKGKLIKTTNY